MIFDITIITVWGNHKPHSCKMVNLIKRCVCSDYSPFSLPPLGLPYPLKHNSIEIKDPTVASKCSNERKPHTPQKPEMTRLSEEGVSRAKTSQKLDLLCQTISQAVNAKGKFLKEIKNATPGLPWSNSG